MQGKCGGELAWPQLSRSRQSHLHRCGCKYKTWKMRVSNVLLFFSKNFFKHFSAFLVSQSFSHLVISQNRFLVVKIRTININIYIYFIVSKMTNPKMKMTKWLMTIWLHNYYYPYSAIHALKCPQLFNLHLPTKKSTFIVAMLLIYITPSGKGIEVVFIINLLCCNYIDNQIEMSCFV